MKRLFLVFFGSASLIAMPAQVVVVRHAEKDPVTRGLTEQGKARAGALAYYFTETDYLLAFGFPDVIFASRSINRSDRIVPRTIETMMPLAQLLQMPIHSPFNGYQVSEMADLVLNDSRYDGKYVLICWNHSSIHDLLNAFGYQAPFSCTAPNKKFPDCRFDLIFLMTFPAPPPTPALPYATVYFQQLMFGDITCQDVCMANPMPPPACSYPPMLPPGVCSCDTPASCALICQVICPDVGEGDD